MNRRTGMTMAAALGLALGSAALGQGPDAGREADHEALRKLKTSVLAAINAQDVKALTASFAQPFTLTPVDQSVVTNEAELSAYFNRYFKDKDAPISKIETTAEADALTRFTGDNSGYCSGSAMDTYTLKDGRVIKIKNRWTAIVVKEQGEWKAAVVHIGVNFMDNPVLTARSMSFWRKVGIFFHLAKPPSD